MKRIVLHKENIMGPLQGLPTTQRKAEKGEEEKVIIEIYDLLDSSPRP